MISLAYFAVAFAAGPECLQLQPYATECAYYRKISGGTPTDPQFSTRWAFYQTDYNDGTGDLGCTVIPPVDSGLRAWTEAHWRMGGWFQIGVASSNAYGSYFGSPDPALVYNDIAVKNSSTFAAIYGTFSPNDPSGIAAFTNRVVSYSFTGLPLDWEVEEADIWFNNGFRGWTNEYPSSQATDGAFGVQKKRSRPWTTAHELGHIIGLNDFIIPGADVATSVMMINRGSPGDNIQPGNTSFNGRVVGAIDFRRSLEIAGGTGNG